MNNLGLRQKRGLPKRFLALLMVMVMLLGMVPATAITIPGTLPSVERYTFTDGVWGHSVDYNGVSGGTMRFKMKNESVPSETFHSWCIDIAHQISDGKGAYLLMPLEWVASDYTGSTTYIKDVNLSIEDTKYIRSILYEVLIANNTYAKLKTAVNDWRTANSITTVSAITTDISEVDFITGVQAAIWSRVANNVSVPADKPVSRSLFTYLLNLAPMEESVPLASATLGVDPITASSYKSADKVDVTVRYTINGYNQDNTADGTPLTGVKLTGVPTGSAIGVVLNNLIADGQEHVITLAGISDTTVLDLKIEGSQTFAHKAYALTTRTDPGDRNQSLVVHELFPLQKSFEATVRKDLSLERGSIVLKKVIANNLTDTAGSFSITLKRTTPYAETIGTYPLAGNAQTTINNLRYGAYLAEELSVPSGYAIVTGSSVSTVAANVVPTLVITNRKLGSIKVNKDVMYSDDSHPFNIQLLLGDAILQGATSSITVSEATPYTFINLNPGTYTISEVTPVAAPYRTVTPSAVVTIPENGADQEVVLTNLYERPKLTVMKKIVGGTTVFEPRDTVTYEVTVVNSGNIPLGDLVYNDTLMGGKPSPSTGSLPSSLEVGASATFQYTYLIPSDKYGTLDNIITVSSGVVSDHDDARASVILKKGLTVVKRSSTPEALKGETVSYTMVITNNGNLPLTDLKYKDVMFDSEVVSLPGVTLLPGESTSVITLGSVVADTADLENTVLVGGNYVYPLENDQQEPKKEAVRSSASATVKVLVPAIEVMKEVSTPIALETDKVTYTLTIRNTGTAALKNVKVTDPILDLDETIEYLGVGVPTTRAIEVTVARLMANTAAWNEQTRVVTNVANVVATPYRMNREETITVTDVSDSDDATFRVLKPSIVISKSVVYGRKNQETVSGASDAAQFVDGYSDQVYAYAGDYVTYRITVTNNSETVIGGDLLKKYDFKDVRVTDPILHFDETFDLGHNEEKTFYVTYHVDTADETAKDTIVNTATVTTQNPSLTDDDQATVDIVKPLLEIVKTPSATSVQAGSLINYTITVTNKGNVPVYGIYVTDQFDGQSEVLLGEDLNLDIIGGRGISSKTYQVSYQTASGFTGTIWNTATAEGYGPMERTVGPVSARVPVQVFIPTVPVTYVSLIVGIEGQGSVLPGIGTYPGLSLNSYVAFSNIVAADGWKFDAWVGTNGSEISASQLLMNANKSVIARFVPLTTPIQDSAPPLAPPEVTQTPAPTPAPASNVTEIVELESTVPQSAPELPKTAGLPLSLLIGLGGLLTIGGLKFRRKQD